MGTMIRFERRARFASAFLMALSVGFASSAAGAQSTAEPGSERLREARSRFERGIELYEEGDMDAALVELRRAHELAPSYKLLFNIGQVQLQKSDYASALDSFERYLAQGGDNIAKKRRGEIESLVQKLRQRVFDITVKVDVEGAEVFVDDLPRGTTPLAEPLVVNAGRRKISAQAPGHTPVAKHIEAAGAESLTVTLTLLPDTAASRATAAAASPAPVEAAPRPKKAVGEARSKAPRQDSDAKVFPWGAWVATGALATGAIVVGALAYDASQDLERKRGEQGATRRDLDDARSRTQQLALAADIVGGAAVLTGALSLYLTVSGGPARMERSTNTAKPGFIGVSASGRF